MSQPIQILGIAGSLRRASYNRGALRAAMQLVPQDTALDIFELDGISGFNQDEEQNPPSKVIELKRRIREADAILIVTPEYNYSIPGVLKNAIVGRRDPMETAGGMGSLWRSWALRSEPSARLGRNTISDRYSSFSICFRLISRR